MLLSQLFSGDIISPILQDIEVSGSNPTHVRLTFPSRKRIHTLSKRDHGNYGTRDRGKLGVCQYQTYQYHKHIIVKSVTNYKTLKHKFQKSIPVSAVYGTKVPE